MWGRQAAGDMMHKTARHACALKGACYAVASRTFESTSERRAPVLVETLAQTCAKAQVQPLTSALLKRSLQLYLDSTPSASSHVAALSTRGNILPASMTHDHFAYRTLGLPGLGIASMSALLNELGYYMVEDGLMFPAKKLTAAWFAHRSHAADGHAPAKGHVPMPRIFVSEIKVEQLSPASQKIIRKYADGLNVGPGQVATAVTCGQLPWTDVSRHEYDTLLRESDYAAWVMVHGYSLNHTALSVHGMRGEKGEHLGLQEAARVAAAHGLIMNEDGGLIKVSGDGLLRQCSSMSDLVPCQFAGSVSGLIPGAYLELVERAPLPQYVDVKVGDLQEWHRRDGFEVANASHLFTSTRV